MEENNTEAYSLNFAFLFALALGRRFLLGQQFHLVGFD